MQIQGKAIIITGASSGIGAALSVALARRGARGIALLARRKDALEKIAADIRQYGSKAVVLPTDIGQDNAVDWAIRAAKAELGPLEIAIANAGISPTHVASAPDFELLKTVYNVNLMGATRLIHGVLPDMLAAQRGHIVGVSSVAGFRGLPGSALYSSSKAALSTLLEGYRVELEASGIQVTDISPGFVKTPMALAAGPMTPWMVEVEDAVERIIAGIERDEKDIIFPWQMKLAMKCIRLLPRPLFDRIGKRVFLHRKTQS